MVIIMKNSDHGLVKKGVRSGVIANARAKFNSAMLPSTTPKIIGTKGEPEMPHGETKNPEP